MKRIIVRLINEIYNDWFLSFLLGLNVGILIAFFILFFSYNNIYADETENIDIEYVNEISGVEENNASEIELNNDVDISIEENIESEIIENVPDTDSSISDQSNFETGEQSDLPDSVNPSDSIPLDEEPFTDDSLSSVPEVNGIVDRDENGALYISEESSDLQSKIDLYEDTLSTDKVDIFKEELIGSEELTDWDIADYFKNVLTQALFDLFGEPEKEELELEEEMEILQAEDDRLFTMGVLESPFLSSVRSNSRTGYKNVVVFHGSFNSYDCDLIIPYDQYKYLLVQNNYLVNVGSSSVTGKILYDDELLDPSNYDSYVYVLNPIYGNTTNVYNYGSFNYRRHYLLTSSGSYDRITSQDMYGNFYVNDIDVYYSNSERTYYGILFILLFMGVNFLWNRRH